MKTFIQSKAAATYYYGLDYSIVIRKDYIEYYHKLKNGDHAVANVEIFNNLVRILIKIGNFKERIENVYHKGMPADKFPKFAELAKADKYVLLFQKDGNSEASFIIQEIETESNNYLQTIGQPEIRQAIHDIMKFVLYLYIEFQDSEDPAFNAITDCFHEF